MLEQISLGADKVIFTKSRNNPKASDPQELAALYTDRYGKMAQVAESFDVAWEIAERAITRERSGDDDRVVLSDRRSEAVLPGPRVGKEELRRGGSVAEAWGSSCGKGRGKQPRASATELLCEREHSH